MSPRQEASDLVHALESGAITRRAFVLRAAALGLSLGTIGLVLGACRGKAEPPAAEADLGPIGTALSIYNWSDYIAKEAITGFEKEFGVRVSYNTYESNEELAAKLQTGISPYDLAVPSGYLVPALAAAGLLAPLNRQYLTNWDNISPLFLDLGSDPGNRYSVPWQWGTTGVAYRSDKLAAPPASWGVFQDPRYRRRMTMMDEGREVIGAWLRYRGHSVNSVSGPELDAARADGLAAAGHLAGFVSGPVKDRLVSGEIWVAQLWNGDTTQARVREPAIAYALPAEGGTIWTDSLVVPRSAPHKRAAHEFLNYILRPDVAASISNATGYGSPNAKAVLDQPVPFPAPDELSRLEYQADLGEKSYLWDLIWSDIRAHGAGSLS